MNAPDLKGKRVYISGPMDGLPGLNRDVFRRAARVLEAEGALPFDPANSWAAPPDEAGREWYLIHDLHMLTGMADHYLGKPFFDLLLLLPGFESSEGALLELSVARACGIECLAADDVLGEGWGL